MSSTRAVSPDRGGRLLAGGGGVPRGAVAVRLPAQLWGGVEVLVPDALLRRLAVRGWQIYFAHAGNLTYPVRFGML